MFPQRFGKYGLIGIEPLFIQLVAILMTVLPEGICFHLAIFALCKIKQRRQKIRS